MRWWRILLVALAFGLATVLATEPISPTIVTTEDRAVHIAALPCDSRLQTSSSGFVLDSNTVVTVAHAIYESRDFAVRDASGRWHDARVRYVDLERDVAILDVSHLPAVPMQTRAARNGEAISMLGGAASGTVDGEVIRRVNISTAIIGDLSVTSKREGYELSIEIKGGDSGSAVVDADGNLVGLIFARSTRRDASWATSVTELASLADATGGPRWSCDSPSDLELIREPLERSRVVN